MTLQSDTTGLRSFRPEPTRPFRPRPKTAPLRPHRDHVRQAFSIVFNFYSSVSVFLFFLCLLYNVCIIFHLCVCLSVLTSVFRSLNDNVSFALFSLSLHLFLFLSSLLCIWLFLFVFISLLFVYSYLCSSISLGFWGPESC